MEREELLCYLEAVLSTERAIHMIEAEKLLLNDRYPLDKPLRQRSEAQRAFFASFVTPRRQDLLRDGYRLSCILDDLYGANLIPERLRGLPTVSLFYEWIASGRCKRLNGPDSACTLYTNSDGSWTGDELAREEESVVSRLNDSIRRYGLAVNPTATLERFSSIVLHALAAVERRPRDASRYAPAVAAADDSIRLARAFYARWLSMHPQRL